MLYNPQRTDYVTQHCKITTLGLFLAARAFEPGAVEAFIGLGFRRQHQKSFALHEALKNSRAHGDTEAFSSVFVWPDDGAGWVIAIMMFRTESVSARLVACRASAAAKETGFSDGRLPKVLAFPAPVTRFATFLRALLNMFLGFSLEAEGGFVSRSVSPGLISAAITCLHSIATFSLTHSLDWLVDWSSNLRLA